MDCGYESDMNHVHHLYYQRGLDPWEYPDNALIILCKECHENEENNLKDSSDRLYNTLRRNRLRSWEIDRITAFLKKNVTNG